MRFKETRGGRAVAVLAAVNAAIMLLRFSEQCILARSLGAGQRFDAYFLGQIVILVGGQLTVAVTSAAVPLMVDAGEQAPAATRRLLLTTAAVLTALCLLIAILSSPIISLLGGKLDGNGKLLARSILLWLTPATAGWILASMMRGYWHARNSFLVPGIAQLFMPVCTCAGAFLLALGVWDLTSVAAIANLGVLALLIVLYKPLARSQPQAAPSSRTFLKDFSQRFRASLLPVSVGLALMPGMVVIARSFAASLATGSVTAISLAASLGSIPAQFAAASVGMVLLSQAALLKSTGRMAEGVRIIERALCNTAFVVTPSAVALVLWSKEIVEVVFHRGAFDKAAVGVTASALSAYSFGIPFQAAVQVLIFALFAVAGSRMVAVTTCVTIGINVLLSQFLLPWGVIGLATAFCISSFVDCAVLFWLLARALPELQVRPFLVRQFRMLLLSVVASEIASVSTRYLDISRASLKLFVALSVCGFVYLGLNLLVKGPELQEIIGTAKSRVSRYSRAEVLTAAE